MLKDKIKSTSTLARTIAALKKKGKKIVFTNGCFDILHLGHVKYLEAAKQKGDVLVVGINSDSSVRKIKGNTRPVITQKERLSIVAALESVDYVLLFNQTTPLNLIKKLKPDILIKGADWQKNKIVGSELVLARGGKVLTIKLIKGRSTTNIIKKIAKKISR